MTLVQIRARSLGILSALSVALASPLASQDSSRANSTATSDSARKTGVAKPKAAKPSAAKPKPASRKPAAAAAPRRGQIPDSAEAARLWPVRNAPRPLSGAILPAKRIVAYYGNPLSKRMGILGELPPEQMLARLDQEVARWNKADPATPVQPALHLIAVVAQGAPGRDGKYRLRMDSALVEKVYGWARQRNAILFLDVQVGHSTLQEELPALERFLKRPDVHLGIDPEFSMHYGSSGRKPGTRIGTFMADDVNFASRFLAGLVTKYNLPPKVLVVHRFTRNMLPNAEAIRLDPKVQVVIDMDGWGPMWLKLDSYYAYVYKHPVEYTGFKLFYRNDTKKPGSHLMSPADVLTLRPRPIYIQYQ